MVDVEASLDVEDGFALGLQYGVMAKEQLGGCEDCSCGLADGDLEEVTLSTDPDEPGLGEFNEELRYLMEFYFPQIDEDTLVGRFEVCADDAPVAYVRE